MTVIERASAPAFTLRRTDLGGNYDLRLLDAPNTAPAGLRDRAIAASVPGQVHTDLMRAGELSNPDVGFGELEQAWIGHSRWSYSRTFEWTLQAGTTELVADGLDTVAEVFLNGQSIARTADQHIGYRWDVSEHVIEGTNHLEVVFDSAWAAALERERAYGPLPTPYDEPYPYIRKSACNFGWDWGPHYVTAGIWQPIAIENWTARIEHVRPLVSLAAGHRHATVQTLVRAELVAGIDSIAIATLRSPEGAIVDRQQSSVDDGADTRIDLDVDAPDLWWPTGYGDQPLYDLTVELVAADGTPLDSWTKAIGIRSVDVVVTPDEIGERWAISVNGRRIRIRGYNWIPEDPFIAEVTSERLDERLDQAVDGNANLLRIWGGGYFATEEFLDGCDRRGLLVWHDFLFACAGYDETGGMADLIRAEAEQAVARLSSHASVAIWCGGNECVWGSQEWSWDDTLGTDRTWGNGFYTELLPSVLADLDPTRPYIPNSPWSTLPGALANDHRSGPTHLWDTWNNRDYISYREKEPAFVSEMGWCAPPAATTLRKVITEGKLLPTNPEVAHHMRASEGMHKLARGIQPYFSTPATEEDWLFRTQLVQARAEQIGTEWLRSRDRGAGVIVWQLNDCWPVLSWSAVDGDGIEKPIWFALRRSFAPRLLTIQPVRPGGTQDPTGDQGLELIAVNDSLDAWQPRVRVRRVTLDGTELARADIELAVGVDGTSRAILDSSIATPSDRYGEILVADTDRIRSTWAYAPDRRQSHVVADWDVSVDGSDVVVSANTTLIDLCLFTDRLADALGLPGTALLSDSQLITLLPGEQHTFKISHRTGGLVPPFDSTALQVGGSIVRAANDSGAGVQ